jgi:hypothetical protein
VKNDTKIHIPSRRRECTEEDGVVRLTREARSILIDIANESNGLSLRQIASKIIIEAYENDLIVFDREG